MAYLPCMRIFTKALESSKESKREYLPRKRISSYEEL